MLFGKNVTKNIAETTLLYYTETQNKNFVKTAQFTNSAMFLHGRLLIAIYLHKHLQMTTY